MVKSQPHIQKGKRAPKEREVEKGTGAPKEMEVQTNATCVMHLCNTFCVLLS
jgi:hypothetical protein